jgi:hypothetical protein
MQSLILCLKAAYIAEILLGPLLPRLLRDAVNGEGDDVVDEDDAAEDAEDEVQQRHLGQEVGQVLGAMSRFCIFAKKLRFCSDRGFESLQGVGFLGLVTLY